MAFTDVFIKRPLAAVAANCLLILFGFAAVFGLSVRQYPLIDATTLSISVAHPGADEEQMLGFVTAPIAQAVAAVEGVDYISSETFQGRSQINVRLKLNVDHQQAFSDLSSSIDSIRYLLPDGATDPVITRLSSDPTAVTYLAVKSADHSVPQITDYINRVILPRLASIDGVGRLEVVGGQDLAVRIWLNPRDMIAMGVTANDIVSALSASHAPAVGGKIEGLYTISDVKAKTEIDSLEGFLRILVKSSDSGDVRIGDVARVELGPKSTSQTAFARGERAVFIAVNATPSGNPLEIMDQVRSLLPAVQAGAPSGFNIEIGFDATRFIESSLLELSKTVLEAIGVVVLVMLFFLGTLRVVLIPIVAVPISLFGAAGILYLFGFSINLLTLLAMVLAIGLVVDDAIVVVENIHRHIHLGLSPKEAALLGAREVVGPVIAMTLTLAAVYAPIGLSTGLTGSLFMEFALALAGSVIVSGIVALTLSPVMAAMALKEDQGGWSKRVNGSFERFSAVYDGILGWVLRRRLLFMVLGLAVGLGAYIFSDGSSRELAPTEDQGYIYTAVQAPHHVNVDYTEMFTSKLQQVFRQLEEFHDSFMINGPVPNEAFGGVILKPWSERDRSQQEILGTIQGASQAIDGISVFAFSGASLPGSTGGFPLQLVLTGPRPVADLVPMANQLIADAYESKVLAFANTDVEVSRPVTELNINRHRLDDIGVSMESVANTLNIFLSENYVSRVELDGRPYEIIPQVDPEYRKTSRDLGEFHVRDAQGNMVQLSGLVDVVEGVAPNKLTQHNQLNSVTIRGVLLPEVHLSDAVSFFSKRAAESLPNEISFYWLGESRQFVQEGNSFFVIFALSIIFIYIVLSVQFNSLTDPAIILVSVPLCLFGAFLPTFLGWTSINIYSQIGIVTLVGLITKHGILMVQFANQLRSSGVEKEQAIRRASVIRLRPVLMTTAAVVFGLLPLVASIGAGAEARFSIGVVIVSGMLFGTILTLFILPCVYMGMTRSPKRSMTAAWA